STHSLIHATPTTATYTLSPTRRSSDLAYNYRLDKSFNLLSRSKRLSENVKVDAEAKFVGFDAYKKAIDMLPPGDVVILATPPALDRKSTRLNSSHRTISYAVFCLKKKN